MRVEIPFVQRGGTPWVVRGSVAVVFIAAALANTLHMIRFGMQGLDIAAMHLVNLALFIVVLGVARESPPRRAFVQGLLGAPIALILANWIACVLLWGPSMQLRPIWSEILLGIVPGCALHGVLVGRSMYALNEVRLRPSHDALDRSLRGLAPLLILGLLDACLLLLHRPPTLEGRDPLVPFGAFASSMLGPFLLASMVLTAAIPLALCARDARRVRFLRALRDDDAWRVEPATAEDYARLLPWVFGGADDATLVRTESPSGAVFRESTPRTRLALVPADREGAVRALLVRGVGSIVLAAAALGVGAFASTLRW